MQPSPRRERGDGERAAGISPGLRNTYVLAGVVALVTVLVMVNMMLGSDDPSTDVTAGNTANESQENSAQEDAASGPADRGDGPAPDGSFDHLGVGELPPGGPFATEGDGTYRTVGAPGEKMGTGDEEYTYVVEVENSIDAGHYGGDDAFAAVVDATLGNPKSWIGDPRFSFRHIAADSPEEPDFRIQLTSTGTTHEVCGNSYNLETSCYMPIGNRVLLNESRWVRGATPFDGDIGAYRQYMINHEVGHGIGYAAHQPCEKDGALAPIMMQQTLSMNNQELYKINPEDSYADNDSTCRPNPWVYPYGHGDDQPGEKEAEEARVSPTNRPQDQR
ncbi:MAG TPA: DUF3152 domain-containing protein [Candidatus Corynebacterium gallistercoris]|uniref:DUF3152 domain-containing protein n=1 Tax=Candidatus Corynebacterium gallistercoris TaxID=2838530 RepID=A0A9D1RYQ9_9CORY|nr:DUF3152 domain-containing protein [Candidatus Corynebacterium gallistercoris]